MSIKNQCLILCFSILGRTCGFNSSAMIWTEHKCLCCSGDAAGSRYHYIYDMLCRHYKAITSIIFKFDHFLEMLFLKLPDEGLFGYLDFYFPGKVVDYLSVDTATASTAAGEGAGGGGAGEGDRPLPSLVTFPIHPKPHDVVGTVLWVQRNWRDE
jgi:hypothetical protein